jgi:Ni2+-binding GTPase involved in maturation of urease and hydrogenase
MTLQCEVHERINTGAAALNRDLFGRHGVFVASLFGWRHCGKTSLLEATLRDAGDDLRIGVVVGKHSGRPGSAAAAKARPAGDCDRNGRSERLAASRSGVANRFVELDVLLIERSGASVVVNQGGLDLGQAANIDISASATRQSGGAIPSGSSTLI